MRQFRQDRPRRHEDTEASILKGDPYDNAITERIIGCAMEVHGELGPGLLESTYVAALCIELEAARLGLKRQIGLPLLYKGRLIGEYRPDLVGADRIVVEVKSIERFSPVTRRRC